ncbi:MAG: ribosomal protein S18-alanine N-acetyltransferase [Thermostichus sp. DG02_5_bins_236]
MDSTAAYGLEVLGGTATLPQLLQLDWLCFGGYWGEQSYRTELERPSSIVLGAFLEEEALKPSSSGRNLIGFGILWHIEDEAHIISLAVHPEHQRRGLGRRILLELLNQARNLGCAWATLEVKASNRAALHLYESVGFQKLGERKGYYNGEDAWVYWKKPI